MTKTRQQHNKERQKAVPPLFTAPEVLRAIALALDTKGMNREVGKAMDEYVSKGRYIHDTHRRLLKDGVVEPISKWMTPETKRHFALLIDSVVTRYHQLVLQFPCYERRRRDVGRNIILLCIPLVMDVLEPFIERLRLPTLESIFEWSNPVGAAIAWLRGECKDWETAVKNFTLKKDGTDYVGRWAPGTSLPSAKSLLEFTGCIKEESRERALVLLFVARAFAHAYSTNGALRDQILCLYSTSGQAIDLARLGVDEIKPSREFQMFMESMLNLDMLLQEGNMLHGNFIQIGLANMDQYHRQSGLPPSSRWALSLVAARAAVADGRLQQALKAYKQAFDEGLYSAGEPQIDIIDEALCVASMQGDVRFLEKLKNQAIAFGMMEHLGKDAHDPRIAGSCRRDNDFVEDWEIKRWREQYYTFFPANCKVIDAAGTPEEPETPFIVINPDEHLEPDLKHPNRVVQYSETGCRYRIPQIHWFALRNDLDSVKMLLGQGADYTTPWKDDGDSVLHRSVRRMGVIDPRTPPDDGLFQLVVPMIGEQNADSKHRDEIQEMIKTPLVKKQATVLGSAVETCRPDVVERVLGLGAPVDQRHTVSRLTPLYWLCQVAYSQRSPAKWMQTVEHERLRMDSAQREEVNRRFGIPSMPRQPSGSAFEIEAEYSQHLMKTRRGIDRAALIAIARILLENEADANACHDINGVQGRTPLMLAVEANDLELFDLMVSFGGDIKRTCLSTIDHHTYTCMDIARRFGADDVLRQLKLMSEPQ